MAVYGYVRVSKVTQAREGESLEAQCRQDMSYATSKGLELPEDVSFHLAPGSHIILALHYKNPGNTPKEITPGIEMVVTKKRTSKVAGVFQIINDYDGISPNRTGIIGN